MRRILQSLFLAAVFYLPLQASHITGGAIYYRYVGDSTGNPHDYEITLELYRDAKGITLGPAANICISSSCYGPQTISLNQVAGGTGPNGGRSIPYYTDCASDSTDPNFVQQYIHTYRDTVRLPGTCGNFSFSYSTCCRNGGITNLQNSASQSFHVEAELNNLVAPNNSPEILFPTQKSFCVLQATDDPFGLNFFALDTDGDSLYYSLGHPQDGNGCSPNTSPIPFVQGLNPLNPISTHHGVLFDSKSGLMRFSPDVPQVVVINVTIEEYRFDSTSASYFKVGQITREQQSPVLSQCSSSLQNLQVKDSTGTANPNAITFIECGDSIIELEFSNVIDCGSIAPDGSDFAILGSQGQLLPIVGAEGTTCVGSAGYANTIRLYLHEAAAANDTLTMLSRIGNDFDFLRSSCLQEYTSMPAQQVIIVNCSTAVSTGEFALEQMQIYPNPARNEVSLVFSSASSNRNIELWDINGKLLLQQEATSKELKLDVSTFPKGMYLIRSTENDQTEVSQLFKN